MFDNSTAIFSAILFSLMAIIGLVLRICHTRDLFLGRAWDIRHREEHWDNQSGAIILSLLLATCGFLVSLAVTSFTKAQIPLAQKGSLPSQQKIIPTAQTAVDKQTTSLTTGSPQHKKAPPLHLQHSAPHKDRHSSPADKQNK